MDSPGELRYTEELLGAYKNFKSDTLVCLFVCLFFTAKYCLILFTRSNFDRCFQTSSAWEMASSDRTSCRE